MHVPVDTRLCAFLFLLDAHTLLGTVCGVSVKRTLSVPSSSDKEHADVPSVCRLISSPCFACQTSAGNRAILGLEPAGPEDPAHRLLSPPCSRHPALPFGATVICSRLLQNRASPALMEWLVLNVVVVRCHLIYLNLSNPEEVLR